MVLTKRSHSGFDSPLARSIAFVILTLSTLLGAGAAWFLVSDIRRADSENDLIRRGERVLSLVKDLETGHRGYVIVGTPEYLEPYLEAQGLIGEAQSEFERVARKNDIPATVLQDISSAIENKMAFAKAGVRLRQDVSEQAAREQIATNVGKRYMDVLRDQIDGLNAQASLRISQQLAPRIDIAAKLLAGAIAGLTLVAAYFLLVARATRRRTERATELVTEIIDNAPVGLTLLDGRGVLRASNAAFAEMVGKQDGTFDKLLFKDVAPALAEKLKGKIAVYNAIQREREVASTSSIQLEEEGRITDLEIKLFPVSLDDEEGLLHNGVGIVAQDVTRQKQWERDLEKARDAADSANRAKSSFIANMSHELRTPLTAVLGYCELLEEDLADLGQEQLIADLNKISVNAKHLLSLINDVLDLSKIEAEKMDVHAVPFKTRQMLGEVENAVGALIAKKDNRLAIKIGPIAPEMNTDDLKLKQVLLNLISNAAKFTENGEITVTVSGGDRDGSATTRFAISDTGIGMTEEQLANLFQRFKQADETTTRKFGGTGLGLALTRALTTMLGGDIAVESAVGKGSTFTIEVPNIYIAPAGESASSIAAHEAKHGERPAMAPVADGSVVLVVDDDASQRDLLTRHLAREGFAVVTATDGIDGIAKARALKPAAILLDVMMPGMNGWHVMKELRGDAATADIPIIIQTVLDEESFAYSLGATEYLKKPVDRAKLGDILKNLRQNAEGDYVLVVDDDAEVRGTLAEMFKRDNWEVVETQDGQQALSQIEERLPALVVADLLMPVMDGYQLVAQIRKNPKLSDLPIVVLTSEDLSKQSVRELMASTTQVVQKGSVPLGELVASLRILTDRKPAETGGNMPASTGEHAGN